MHPSSRHLKAVTPLVFVVCALLNYLRSGAILSQHDIINQEVNEVRVARFHPRHLSKFQGCSNKVYATNISCPSAVQCNPKTKELKFLFTGNRCLKIKNSQGDFSCHHEAKSKMKYPLRIEVTSAGTGKDNYKDNIDIFDGTINQKGEIFALQLGKSEEINVKISDTGSGKVYQVMKFHGSCFKPLFLGDEFGALKVVELSAKHDMTPCCSSSVSKSSSRPTAVPSTLPSYSVPPSSFPTSELPSFISSHLPSEEPSIVPSYLPSRLPSMEPSRVHSSNPSLRPSSAPSQHPTRNHGPSQRPSRDPSATPSLSPSCSSVECTQRPDEITFEFTAGRLARIVIMSPISHFKELTLNALSSLSL